MKLYQITTVFVGILILANLLRTLIIWFEQKYGPFIEDGYEDEDGYHSGDPPEGKFDE